MTGHPSKQEKKQGNKPTRRQHFVPKSYQKGWTAARWALKPPEDQTLVWVHDLQKLQAFDRCPINILVENWYYEKDRSKADNEIEKYFQSYEGDFSSAMRFLDVARERSCELAKVHNVDSGELFRQVFERCFVEQPQLSLSLKRFAALTYVRVPAALEQKQWELSSDADAKHLAESVKSPYSLVSAATTSTLVSRFESLSMQFLLTVEAGFVASDRPCFDFDASNLGFAPLFGYDVGRSEHVFAVFPLSPHICMIMTHPLSRIFPKNTQDGAPATRIVDASGVRCTNDIIIQMAKRWVISFQKDEEIFARSLAKTP